MLANDVFRSHALQVPSPPDVAENQQGSRRLFENLACELHATAVGIAVVTTAANAILDWRTTLRPEVIARFAPEGVTLRSLLTVLQAQDGSGLRCAEELANFLDDMDMARGLLDDYLDDCDTITAQRASIVHARVLQAGWQPLCRSAKGIVVEVDHDLPVALPELFAQNTRVVSALLTGAANGLRPCLNAEGKLYVPPLPQRRRWPRRTLLQNCIIYSDGQRQNAFLRDASAGGLGLGRVTGLSRGDRVRVAMTNGRTLHGVVIWTAAGSAGVGFMHALAPDDPLIAV